jgi:hypothetical protein
MEGSVEFYMSELIWQSLRRTYILAVLAYDFVVPA